jgi:hypothetical protein
VENAAVSENFQGDVLSKLALLFEPLATASRDIDARRVLLAAIGWLIDEFPHTPGSLGAQIDEALQAFGAATDSPVTLADAPPDSLPAALEALDAPRRLFDADRALSSLPDSGQLPRLSALGEDLIGFLILHYLRVWTPLTYRVLALLTVITPFPETPPSAEVRDAAGVVVRVPYRPGALHMDRIGHVLSDPIQMLREEYLPAQLSSEAAANAVAHKLLPRVRELLWWVGAYAEYDASTHILSYVLPPIGEPDPTSLTFAISAGPVAPGLVIASSRPIDVTKRVGLWDVALKLDTTGRFVVGWQGLSSSGPPPVGRLSLARGAASPTEPAMRVGSQTGTRLEVGRLRVTEEFTPTPRRPSYDLLAEASSASIVIVPGDGDGFLQALLPTGRLARAPV